MRKSFFYGLSSTPIAAFIGWLVSHNAAGQGYENFPIFAVFGAFISTTFLSWLIIVKRQSFTFKAGALVGVLTGFFSHFTCWYIFLLYNYLDYHYLGGVLAPGGEEPVGPVAALSVMGIMSFFSLIVVGWITIPLGGIYGVLVVKLGQDLTFKSKTSDDSSSIENEIQPELIEKNMRALVNQNTLSQKSTELESIKVENDLIINLEEQEYPDDEDPSEELSDGKNLFP